MTTPSSLSMFDRDDSIPWLHSRDFGSNCLDNTDSFMAWGAWKRGFEGVAAFYGVDVRGIDGRGEHLDENVLIAK